MTIWHKQPPLTPLVSRTTLNFSCLSYCIIQTYANILQPNHRQHIFLKQIYEASTRAVNGENTYFQN